MKNTLIDIIAQRNIGLSMKIIRCSCYFKLSLLIEFHASLANRTLNKCDIFLIIFIFLRYSLFVYIIHMYLYLYCLI